MVAIEQTFFISHGSPMISIDDSYPAREFLMDFKEKVFSRRSKGILVISAHWETCEPAVNIISGLNDTIHDFTDFPKSMYQLKYPAPGAPDLAKRVKELLMTSGFDQIMEDQDRGLDHGAWIPLMLMYPKADIPVCQLSVQTNQNGTYHYKMGRALSPLKDEGYLIIGSGAATHNPRPVHESGRVHPVDFEFDSWLKEALLSGRYDDINHYEEKAPHGTTAHPTPEHLYPLHVAMGAAGEHPRAHLIHQSWSDTSLSPMLHTSLLQKIN